MALIWTDWVILGRTRKLVDASQAERVLHQVYPDASLALVIASITPNKFRLAHGGSSMSSEFYVDDKGYDLAVQYIERELSALDWIRNNPNTAQAFLNKLKGE